MAHEPEVQNSWAPEMFYDEDSGEYYIFWASSIPKRHSPIGQLPDAKTLKITGCIMLQPRTSIRFLKQKCFLILTLVLSMLP